MGKKVIIFSVLAIVGMTVLTVAAGAVVFALSTANAVQVEEVFMDDSIEVTPLEVEQVRFENPILESEHPTYAKEVGHGGGCSFSSKAQLTQIEPANETEVVGEYLLTLAK